MPDIKKGTGSKDEIFLSDKIVMNIKANGLAAWLP